MKYDRHVAENIAAILRSTQFIELDYIFRQLEGAGQKALLTDSLLSISQALRTHSARTREYARQIRAHGHALRETQRSTRMPTTREALPEPRRERAAEIPADVDLGA